MYLVINNYYNNIIYINLSIHLCKKWRRHSSSPLFIFHKPNLINPANQNQKLNYSGLRISSHQYPYTESSDVQCS